MVGVFIEPIIEVTNLVIHTRLLASCNVVEVPQILNFSFDRGSGFGTGQTVEVRITHKQVTLVRSEKQIGQVLPKDSNLRGQRTRGALEQEYGSYTKRERN